MTVTVASSSKPARAVASIATAAASPHVAADLVLGALTFASNDSFDAVLTELAVDQSRAKAQRPDSRCVTGPRQMVINSGRLPRRVPSNEAQGRRRRTLGSDPAATPLGTIPLPTSSP